MINFELISAALFTKVSGALNFSTKSRVLKHWSDLGAAEFDAFYQAMDRYTNLEPKRGLDHKWQIYHTLWIYVLAREPNDVPSTLLNNAIKAVGTALDFDPVSRVQNLGLANVSHCWLDGTIETDEGTLGQIAVAKIPVSILAAP